MNNHLQVSSSPHIRDNSTTRKIMIDVIIALVPATIVGIYMFSARAALVIAVCILSCVLCEYVYNIIAKKDNTINDLSAVVTGLILGLNLSATIPLPIVIFGSIIAIIIIKQLFGGLGQNFINPAIGARIILSVSFALQMNNWVNPWAGGQINEWMIYAKDAVTGATPLASAAEGSAQAIPDYIQMFLGSTGGCIGETSAVALLLGGMWLVYRKVITIEIPVVFIGTVFLLTWVLGADPLFHILSGGLMLGAIFMATDYVTSPMTKKGKIIFGFGCGLITAMIRLFGSLPEGVSFSILLMNILTPLIDRYTVPKSFGGEKIHE